MSTQIDERVVAMKFDARDFDNNVQKTMTLLDKFKDQLNFKGAQKGLEDITVASNKVSLSHLEEAAIAVEAKFSAMSMVAISAINNIVTTAMNAGTQIVKSLTIDQVTAGFNKYEEKVKAVQTIMNATGLSIEEVSSQLDRLSWFTDETSYSFTDMVNNVGKFTSYNVDLKDAITAMQGIANWAAVSGGGVNEASRAMYNLSQAMALGEVRLQDWRSIENANMATSEFKQTVLDTAVALGTLTKSGDMYKIAGIAKDIEVSVTNFTSDLDKGWFSNEVLMASLSKYGEYADAVFNRVQNTGELAAEAMQHLSGETMELGKKAFLAAQEAKTFTDAIEATKDAVSTGWMQTWEYIFGNYEEAKTIWTELTNVLWDVFAASGEARNEMLQLWVDMGGRAELLDTIRDAWEAILTVVEPLKNAIEEVFPPMTAERLMELIAKFRDFVSIFELTERQAYALNAVFKVLLIPIYAIYQAIGLAITAVGTFIVVTVELIKTFLTLIATTNPVEDFFRNLFGDERYERAMIAIAKIINNIADAFNRVREMVSDVIKQIKESEKLREIFEKIIELLEPVKEVLLDAIVAGLEALAEVNFDNIERFASTTLNTIVDKLSSISPILKGILDFLDRIGTSIKNFFTGTDELSASIDNVNDLKNSFTGLNTTITGFKDNFNLDSILSGTGALTEKLGVVVDGLAKSFTNLVGRLEPAKILLFAFGTALTGAMFNLTKALTAFAGVGTAATSVLNNTAGAIKTFGDQFKPNKLMQIAQALIVLAGAVAILSFIDPVRLGSAVLALAGLATVLGLLTAGLAAIEKYLLKEDEMKKVTNAFVKMGVALAALSASLVILSGIETEGLAVKIAALIVVIVGLSTAVTLMSKFAKKDISKNTMVVISFAVSLLAMVSALKKLADFDGSRLLNALGSLLVLMGLLALMSRAMGEIKFSSSAGVTLMIANLFLVSFALEALANIPMESIKAALPQFIALMGMLTLLMLATKEAGENAAKAGIFIVALSASMIILGEAIRTIGSFDVNVAIQGTIVVGTLIGLFTALTAFTKNIGEHVDKMSKTFVMLSISIMLLSVCISYLGKLDAAQVAKGTIAVIGLLAAITYIMKMNSVVLKEGEKFKSGAGAMIAMAALLGVTTTALAILTLLPDQDRLLTSAASLSMVMLAMGVAVKLMGDINWSSGLSAALGLLAMFVPLGVGFSLLNSMEINEGLIEKAASIALIMVALGVAIRACSTTSENGLSMVEGAYKAMLAFTLLTIPIGIVLTWMDGIDPVGAIANALALSELLIALGVATRLLPTNSEADTIAGALPAILIFGTVIAGLSAVLIAMDGLDPIKAVANAFALSELLVALGLAIRLLPTGEHEKIAAGAIPVLLTFSVVAVILGVAIAAIGDLHPANAVANAVALGVLIVALSGSMALLSLIKDFNFGAVAQALGAALLVVAALAGVLVAMAWLSEQADLEAGVKAFGQLGAMLGEAIGQFFGHLAGAISDAFPRICENIIDGINKFADIKPGIVDGATNVALAILAITALEIMQGLGNLINSGMSLTMFGEQLSQLGPAIAKFADSVKDVNVISLTSATNAVKTLGEAYGEIQKSISNAIGGALTGTGTFKTFAEDFVELAPALKKFADECKDIDLAALDNGVSAAKKIVDLENALAKHGGLLQAFFGDAALSVFADNLVRFAYAMWHYSDIITQGSGLDINAMQEAVGAGQALADLESSLRGHGGIFNIFGDADLGQFGSHISTFGLGLAAYSASLNGTNSAYGPVDVQAIIDSVPAGEALANLEKGLGATNGTWQSIFGGKEDLGNFANNIQQFGEGLAKYYFSISSISDWSRIEQSTVVGTALSELEAALPETGGWDFWTAKADFKTFGDNLESLGKAIKKYDESLLSVDFNNLRGATTGLRGLVELAREIDSGGNLSGLVQLSGAITNLANSGISDFVEEINNADSRFIGAIVGTLVRVNTEIGNKTEIKQIGITIVTAVCDAIDQNESKIEEKGNEIVSVFVSGIEAKGKNITIKGYYIIACLVTGITSRQKDVETALQDAVNSACSSLSTSAAIRDAAKGIGTNVMTGLVNGIKSEQTNLKNTMANVSNMMIDTSKKALEVHSPSVVFTTIGENVIEGLENGLEKNTKSLNQTMKKSMSGLIDTAVDEFKIDKSGSQVMRDEIGVYLVKGIADGITTETSAEEAAAKKAQNIVNAFKNALEQYSYEANLADLEYNIWENAYGKDASEEEIKNMQKQNYEARLAAKGKELAANQAALTALEMKGFTEGTAEWRSQNQAVLKSQDEYGKLINEYIEAVAIYPTGVSDKMEELNKSIESANREITKASDEYDIWYNQYGRDATDEQIKRKEAEKIKAQMESAGQILGSRKALAEIMLKVYGEDSDEYLEATDTVTEALKSYQEYINDYIDIVDQNDAIISKLNESLKKYSDNSTMADLEYKMWENQYGKTAKEDELKAKQQANLEAKLAEAGKMVSTNQAILNLIMEQYGKDSDEYMEANQTLANSIISYQDLINNYMELMNPTTEEAGSIRDQYQNAATAYRELMENSEWLNGMMQQGFTREQLHQYALDKAGLNKIGGNKDKISYEETYDKYLVTVDTESLKDKLNYQDLFDEYAQEIKLELDFDEEAEKPDFFDIWDRYTPKEIEVQIDALGEIIQDATKKKTKKATKSGAKSGTKSGLSSGVSSGVSDFASILNSGSDADVEASFSELQNALTAKFPDLPSLIAQGGTSWGDAFNEYLNSGTIAGWLDNLAAGATAGVDNLAAQARGWLESVAANAASGFTSFFGIHSPSTLMEYYGEQIDLGVKNGVLENADKVVGAMSSLGSKMLGAITSDNYTIKEVGKSIVTTIIEGFNQTSYTVYTRISEALAKTAALILENDQTTYYDAGSMLASAMIDGMIDTVRNRQAEAINEIVALATQMYEAAKAELGIGMGMEVVMGNFEDAIDAYDDYYGDDVYTYSTEIVKKFNKATDAWWDHARSEAIDKLEWQVQNGIISNDEFWMRKTQLLGGVDGYIWLDTEGYDDLSARYSEWLANKVVGEIEHPERSAKEYDEKTGGSSTVYNFYQTNNSPEALSRIEIYRDTKNLLSSASTLSSSSRKSLS